MQCSNTWTMETSHDWKSNTKSFKNWILLEGLGKQVGFQLWLKWGVCLCVADERQIIPGYGTLIGERSLAYVFVWSIYLHAYRDHLSCWMIDWVFFLMVPFVQFYLWYKRSLSLLLCLYYVHMINRLLHFQEHTEGLLVSPLPFNFDDVLWIVFVSFCELIGIRFIVNKVAGFGTL